MMGTLTNMLPQWAGKKKDTAGGKGGGDQDFVLFEDRKEDAREAEERIRRIHEARLAHMRDDGFFDCVCPIWILAFLLVAVVSFTPLFSSFMAVYVVKKRVDDLVPKNLNVTAVDAAFVFQNTFARPLRESGGDIAVALHNRLQLDEWDRRLEALQSAARGNDHARKRYNLPSLTQRQEDFLERLCDGWMEQVPDAHKTGSNARWRSLHEEMLAKLGEGAAPGGRTAPCIDASEASAASSCVWGNVSSASQVVPPELRKSLDDPAYVRWLEGHFDNMTRQGLIEQSALEHIYGSVDNVVRKGPIGRSFAGHGFVALWGVDLNESGGVLDWESKAEYDNNLGLRASRDLKFYCGWKHGGLRSARTINSLRDHTATSTSAPAAGSSGTSRDPAMMRGASGRTLAYGNFSWLSSTVPWGDATAVEACALTCATTQFGVWSEQYKPPRSTHPHCDCRANSTQRFYFGADFESSVTVLRPAKNPPQERPKPYVRSATTTSAGGGGGGKTTTFYPSVVANYSSYLWVQAAQTFDAFALLNNISADALIARTVALARRPAAGLSFSADWLGYNLSFAHTIPQLLQSDNPAIAAAWPELLGYKTLQDTLVDSDMIGSNYVAKKVRAPTYEASSGRVKDCSLPRWFYGFDRSPAPCGVESSFGADTLTLYRVTPVIVRRQNILQNGQFSETPVRVANVVVGRRLPVGLIEKVMFPLARQSAFQFSLVDATTMRQVACVDGTNPKTRKIFAGTDSAVRTVWDLAWNTLASYVPDDYVPLSWRYPLTSEALYDDDSFDWADYRYHGNPNLTAAAAERRKSGDEGIEQHREAVENSMFLPPDAMCSTKSPASQVLDILSGRVQPEFPLVDSERFPLQSLEDFTTAPRVVFSEAYLYAMPIDLEDHNVKDFNPALDIERSLCESYGVDEIAEYVYNRDPARPSMQNSTPGGPGSHDVACSSDRNTMASEVIGAIRNTMRMASTVAPIDSELLKVEEAAPPPTTDSSGKTAAPTTTATTEAPSKNAGSSSSGGGGGATFDLNANSQNTDPKSFFRKNKNRGGLYIVVTLQSRDLLELVLKSRSQVVVTSAICAFIIVIAIFVVIRGLAGPLKQLRRTLLACTDLSFGAITNVNGSTIAEVLALQFSMSYITVKMKSFARFLPPGLRQFGEAAQHVSHGNPKNRRIFSVLNEGDSSDSDEDRIAGSRVFGAGGGGGAGSTIADDYQSLGYSVGDGGDAPGLYGAQGLSEDMEDDMDYEAQVMEKEIDKLDMSGRSTNYARQMHYASLGPTGLLRARKEAKKARQRAWRCPSLFHARRDLDGERRPPVITAERMGLNSTFDLLSQETPLHSIYVDVRYEGVPIDVWAEESEKVQRRVLSGDYASMSGGGGGRGAHAFEEKPLVLSKFMLKYRSTDPLVQLVSRGCREVLQERPGETLLIFVDSPDGKVQIVHNEDMLFALEQHTSRGTLSPIEITVAKRKPKMPYVGLILFLTIGGTLSRIGLAFQRMGLDLEARVRLIGVLLIASLTMQLACNILLYVYLLHKLAKADLEFHMWRQVSRREIRGGFFLSLFSIANFEFLGSYKFFCGDALRFTAPLTPPLVEYVRHATFFAFIFSDLIPLVILWVETVLRQSYDDAALWFTTLFGVFALGFILLRHGMLSVLVDVKPEGNRTPGPFSGKTQGLASLSRKEATVVRLRLAQSEALLSTLDMHHVDTLCEAVYSIVSPLVRSAGGLMVRVDGLCFTVIFNAANNTPHHAAAAFSFVWLVNAALRRHMAPLLAEHAHRYWKLDTQLEPGSFAGQLNNKKVLDEFCARWHRVVAGVVTAEMAVGYSGSSLLRTYQHADWTQQFADGLMNLAEHYGAEVLTNEQCAMALQQASEPTGVMARRPALLRHIDVVGAALLEPSILRLMSDRQASEYRLGLRREKVFEALSMVRGLPIHGTWKVPREMQAIFQSGFSYPYDDACASLLLAHARMERNGPFECSDKTAAKPIIEQQAVRAALAKFAQAAEQIFVCQEPRLMQQYVKDHPMDEVAARVYRWARFFGSPNQSEGVVFPRLLSGMGVQPHPCELLHGVGSQATTSSAASNRKNVKFRLGNTAAGGASAGAAAAASAGSPHHVSSAAANHPLVDPDAIAAEAAEATHQQALQESRRYFDIAPLTRPPRSERRMQEAVRGGGAAAGAAVAAATGGSRSVFDEILDQNLSQRQFAVTFGDRSEDEPINDL